MRYTQRGVSPSLVAPPYTIESHMADALAVLDFFGLDRAWAIGHSWGGHLALHLAVAHPERLLGIVCIDPLGAYGGDLRGVRGQLSVARLSPGQIARIEEVEALRREGAATEADLLERWAIVWPLLFRRSRDCAAEPLEEGRRRVLGGHERVDRGALRARHARRSGSPGVTLPAFFVHGVDDPLPPRSSIETAALIPGARVELIEDCGHFPWLERPGAVLRAYQLFQ